MKESYVSYEIAKRLKECGFDWKCDHYYCAFDNETDVRFWGVHPPQSNNAFRQPDNKVIADAPTMALAQKWLRDVKGIAINVIAHDGGKWEYDIVFLPNAVETDGDLDLSPWCKTYEEALEEGIDTVLKLLEE